MLIACKCLNITLKSTANLPVGASISNYDDITYKMKTSIVNQAHTVSSAANQHDLEDNYEDQPPYILCSTADNLNTDQLQFFNAAKLSTASLIAPSIQHTNLISIKRIENWNLYICRHCNKITHAQATDSAKTLINPLLWTNQEKINIIKTQKNFSKSFNILLMTNVKSSDLDIPMIDTNNTNLIENGDEQMKELQQFMNDVLQAETVATQERIDRYAMQQMALLKTFREKTEQDYQDISRVVQGEIFHKNTSVTDSNTKLISDLTPPVTPDSTPMSIGNSPNFRQQPSFLLLSNQNQHKLHVTKINHSTPEKVSQQNSNVDEDIFFDMDGIDTRDSQIPHMTQSDNEDVDNDEPDFDDLYDSRSSAIKIVPTIRKNNSKMLVAQSLPMAVPTFNQRNEEDYEEYPDRQNNVDIAASIKALAQSVHGEAIFGDLPKPRFSTQI